MGSCLRNINCLILKQDFMQINLRNFNFIMVEESYKLFRRAYLSRNRIRYLNGVPNTFRRTRLYIQ